MPLVDYVQNLLVEKINMLVVGLVSAPSKGCSYLGLVPSMGGKLDMYTPVLVVPKQAFGWVVFDVGEVGEVASVLSHLYKGWPTDALKQINISKDTLT